MVPETFEFTTDEMTKHLASWLEEEAVQLIRGPESKTLIYPVPDYCNVCGHDAFDIAGCIGHYEGSTGGNIYAATCLICDTPWIARFGGNPTSWDIADDPWWNEMKWKHDKALKLTLARSPLLVFTLSLRQRRLRSSVRQRN